MNRLSIGLGLAALVAAFAAALLPGPATELATTPVAVAGVGVASIGLGALLWIQQGSSDRSPEPSRESSPETDVRVGRQIDAALRPSSPETLRRSPFGIRRRVRRTLETVLVERAGLSKAEAVERRRAGDWTANPRAATFLGEADARPWRMRARDWLYGDAFETNLRATIAELDRLVTDLERTHRVDTLWAGDHRTDRDVGVGTSGARGAAGVDAGAPFRGDRASQDEPLSRTDRERLDDALDERASALSRSGPGESTDRSDVRAGSDASEVSR